ncbi:MAG TPA: deoxyhypusine synthase family protein [Thermoanaerobaculia bacterium]|nr:deoxyhypusine synthase family protein [Thermoanaerobaculia bacterium]
MPRRLRDGSEDGLEPLVSLDPRQAGSVSELLEAMSRTAFGGRRLGEAFGVLREMAADPSCEIIVTISGAMSVAKMGGVLCTMMESGHAHFVVTTGAFVTHSLSEAIGASHYKMRAGLSDRELYERGYNRIYDSLELESSLEGVNRLVDAVLTARGFERPMGSYELHHAIGEHLAANGAERSILGCAYRTGVPVYVPAFTDSEVGLAVATHGLARSRAVAADPEEGVLFVDPPLFNPYLDLYDFARRLAAAETLGIFTVGGGVPRNWAQQIGPFFEVINSRLGTSFEVPRIRYGVRICPEPEHWGGLSGCSYSEGVSWGKFLRPEEGGRFAEVLCDATIAWPLLVRGLLETQGARERRTRSSSGERTSD